jgi:hypothetical protein
MDSVRKLLDTPSYSWLGTWLSTGTSLPSPLSKTMHVCSHLSVLIRTVLVKALLWSDQTADVYKRRCIVLEILLSQIMAKGITALQDDMTPKEYYQGSKICLSFNSESDQVGGEKNYLLLNLGLTIYISYTGLGSISSWLLLNFNTRKIILKNVYISHQ